MLNCFRFFSDERFSFFFNKFISSIILKGQMKKFLNSEFDNSNGSRQKEMMLKKISDLSEQETSQNDQSLRQSLAIERKIFINEKQPKSDSLNLIKLEEDGFRTPKKIQLQALNGQVALDIQGDTTKQQSTAVNENQLSSANATNQKLFQQQNSWTKFNSGLFVHSCEFDGISDQYSGQNRKLKAIKDQISIEMSKMSKVILQICQRRSNEQVPQSSIQAKDIKIKQQNAVSLKYSAEIQDYEQRLRDKHQELQVKSAECNQVRVELEQIRKQISYTLTKTKLEKELSEKLNAEVHELEKKVKGLAIQTAQRSQEYQQRQMRLQNQINELNNISKDFMELLQAKNHIIEELERSVDELRKNEKKIILKQLSSGDEVCPALNQNGQLVSKLQAKVKQLQADIQCMTKKLESSAEQLGRSREQVCILQAQVGGQKQALNKAIWQCNHGISTLEGKHKRIVEDLNSMIRDLNHKNKQLQEETTTLATGYAHQKQQLMREYEQKILQLTERLEQRSEKVPNKEKQHSIEINSESVKDTSLSNPPGQHLLSTHGIKLLLDNQSRKCKQLQLILDELMTLDRTKQCQIQALNDQLAQTIARNNRLSIELAGLRSKFDESERRNCQVSHQLDQIGRYLLRDKSFTPITDRFQSILAGIHQLECFGKQKQKQNEQIIEELINNESQFKLKCLQNQKIMNLCRKLIDSVPADARPQFEDMLLKILPRRVRTQ